MFRIRKLELQAAVLTVRLKCTILEEINIDTDKARFWTDSKLTLSYMKNSFKRFFGLQYESFIQNTNRLQR